MRICILSEYSGSTDEGMRNIAYHLGKELSRQHQVLHLGILPRRNLLQLQFWKRMRDFGPKIINFIPGPSLKALMFLKIVKLCCPRAKTVVFASHPFISRLGRRLIPLFKPDLVLTPYPVKEGIFSNAGCNTCFMPNGIDTERFTPVSREEKLRLRQKYQVAKDRFVALHVGAVDRDRNVPLLSKIQQEPDTQVLIVGSLSLPMEPDVYQDLVSMGCLVWREYFPNIEEIYRLSDCYVFPTVHWRKSVELPVSVLEAMSCNLPVISTPYKVLPQLFTPGDGLSFADKEEDFPLLLRQIKSGVTEVKTRDKVLPYSWEDIINKLEQVYSDLA